MDTFGAMQVALGGGEALLISALLMGIAFLGATQASASQRHLIWCAVFGALLALPLFALFAPSFVHLTMAAPKVVPLEPMPLAVAMTAPANGWFAFDMALFVKSALWLWATGVAVIALRATIAAFALWRLRATSDVHRFGHLPISGPRCELRMATRDEGRGPITWGVLRPVILLPKEAAVWPRERLSVVLRHELAHVARRDCLSQMLALAVCALYWPNPLVWLGARRLRHEAEIAADDAVIESGVRPSAYASELLQIAREVRRLSPMPVAMAAPSALEARVKAVLASAGSRAGVTMKDAVRLGAIGAAAAMVLAFARPTLALETPPAPPAPPHPVHAVHAIETPETPATPETPMAPTPVAFDNSDGSFDSDSDSESDDGDAPVAPTAPIAVQASANGHGITVIQDDDGKVHIYRNGQHLTPAQQAIIQRAVRKAQAAVEAARPEIERAAQQAAEAIAARRAEIADQLADARSAEADARQQLREQQADAEAQVREQQAEARQRQAELRQQQKEIQQQIAEAHRVAAETQRQVQEQLRQQSSQLRVQMAAAQAAARAAMAKMRVTISDVQAQAKSWHWKYVPETDSWVGSPQATDAK
jgi:beta-lactamase regulating signal transducer with metallopeptidase domain